MDDFRLHPKYKELFKLLDPAYDNEYKDIRYVVITGGRGSGKSVALSCFVNEATYEGHNVLFTRYTMTAAKESVIPEFREKCEWLGDESSFLFKEDKVINKQTDARIIYKGQKPSSNTANGALKSVNGISIFVTEEAQEVVDYDLWDRINKSIRMVQRKNLVILVLNPTDVNHWIYKEFFADNAPKKAMTLFVHTDYLDNQNNLDKNILKEAEIESKLNPSRYANIWLGQWVSDTEGALWSMSVIQRNRIQRPAAEYKRIVVSVDPAVTSNDNSDEYGIVVCGETFDNEYHVLEDISKIMQPHPACELAIALYNKWQADKIIAEVNNGGDWIESLLRTVDSNISYETVRATRGKITRAEPISSLYERDRVKHVGVYQQLEYEMCTYTGDKRDQSPNRLDAMVWGITYLSQDVPAEIWTQYF